MQGWRSYWGTWRIDSADGRFAFYANLGWVYGPGDAEGSGAPVVSALDVTLADVVAPKRGAELFPDEIRDWRRAASPDWVYVPQTQAQTHRHLRDLDRAVIGPRKRGGLWVALDASAWSDVASIRIGLRAPELSLAGRVRILASAERDVRIARRLGAASAARRRIAVHGLASHGASRGQLARVLGVSRERVQQLVSGPYSGGTEGYGYASLSDLRMRDAEWRAHRSRLETALRTRRERVLAAHAMHGMGLGEIADILGISRARAQQLRDSAER